MHRLDLLARTALVMAGLAGALHAGQTERLSGGPFGEGNGDSYDIRISADGRHVVFNSMATNLVVAPDRNNTSDIFLARPSQPGFNERISKSSRGEQANGYSYFPDISATGRYVAFGSLATNLVAGDDNQVGDIFLRDRVAGTTVRVSTGLWGPGNRFSTRPAVSDDGGVVAFESLSDNFAPGDDNGTWDVFARFMNDGDTIRVSMSLQGDSNGASLEAAVSGNGRYVAFASDASNLVPGDSNGRKDIFVRDILDGAIVLISRGPKGIGNEDSLAPALSFDGRYVTFVSLASNLVPHDTNRRFDVFVIDRDPDRDGVFDEGNSAVERVSVGDNGMEANDDSTDPDISADGRFITYGSQASNLIPGDNERQDDIFLFDRSNRTVRRLSVDGFGNGGNKPSRGPAISADGRIVVYQSDAKNIAPQDGNGATDVFAYDPCVPASWENYGEGWPGTRGVPGFTSSDTPRLCARPTLIIENSQGRNTSGVLFIGMQTAELPTAFDGTLLLVPRSSRAMQVPVPGLYLPVQMPCDSAWCGRELLLQVLQVDPGASAGVSFTRGLRLTIGE